MASLRNRACQMIGVLGCRAAEPRQIPIADRELGAGIVAATGAVEVAVHGWDVARACRQDRPVPPALAEELLDLGRCWSAAEDRPTRFAPGATVAGPGQPQ